ncbi:helix-turn-helix transcriptional regulator [Dietzia sp. PP-33]|uniref:helix-turn-helix domain-containing protein n=1 Tax=Dietzia sp. PP-33 TaxID=2957500 RepID=UPI0029BF0567|nr:helix-turn-helix transcriptional regulator [Dietzia sp. PP-33]MDX2358410.1 helix-turn-helix transcriptional regulator [Dietzia sp. PP-33]
MTTNTRTASTSVGSLLRQWRMHRRVSQLELSSEADISTRHLSFVETGRSQPSRDMVLRIAAHLDVPLRDRNQLLMAAGFAPRYSENELTAPALASVRTAVREVLAAHEPYPALAVDRTWNVLETNAAVDVLTQVVSPRLLAERPLNALRMTLHPLGMAPHIANLPQWRAFVLGGLRRSALACADAHMLSLHDELASYPHAGPEDAPLQATESNSVYVPLLLNVGGARLSFLAMIATFGTALDVTLSELAIETFLPADASTAAYLAAQADPPRTAPAAGSSP